MVNKILDFLNKEVNGLHQAAYLLAFFAFLSQILALVRDKLLAHTFGASTSLDIYYTAFRIPDFIFVTIGSMVSMSVLVPFIVARLEKNEQTAKDFVNSIFSFFVFVISIVGIIVFLLLPFLTKTLFPGFSGENLDELILITKILLLSPLFLGISNLLGSLTQSTNRFLVYALSPVLYNAGIIFGIMFLYPKFGIKGLAWGVIVGAILHMAIQIFPIRKIGLIPKITFKPQISLIKDTILTSVPRTLALSFGHISILFLISMASFFPEGSISVFNFSFNLQSVPLSIIGVSYSLAAFPTLSKLFTLGQKEDFFAKVLLSVKHIIFWSIPFAVLFIVLRAHIVRVVLGSGQFDWSDTRLTAAALALFSVSLLFQNLILILVRSFYSMGKTKLPLIVNFVSAVSVVLFAKIFYQMFQSNEFFRFFLEDLFKISDLAGTVVVVLPLSFALGSILNGLLLWVFLEKELPGLSKSVSHPFLHSLSASIIMGFFIFISLRFFDDIFSLDKFFGILAQALFSGVIGIFAGILVLKMLRNKEIEDIWLTLHQRFWKTKVVGPDSEVI